MKTYLTLETAKLMFKSTDESIKQFALDNYPELAENKLPSTWEEIKSVERYYIDMYSNINFLEIEKAFEVNYNVSPTESLAKAHLSNMKLHYLKHVYNDGWEPDYTKFEAKYYINFIENKPGLSSSSITSNPLTFKTEKLAELFLKNFIEDIIIAKELI